MEDRGLDIGGIALRRSSNATSSALARAGCGQLVVVPEETAERLDVVALPLGLEPGLAGGLDRRLAVGQDLADRFPGQPNGLSSQARAPSQWAMPQEGRPGGRARGAP